MNPENTALILIGYQNDYFEADGILHGVIESDAKAVLANTLEMLNALADSKLTIISTPILFTDDYQELDQPVGILKTIKDVGAFKRSSYGGETIAELKSFGDRIIEVPGKRGLNAFARTELENVLRKHGIQHVVLAGVVTSICIDSTGRSAHERGFSVYVLRDATCGRTDMEQDFYCENIFPLYANVLDHHALIEAIR
ncbi:MAG: isochorismatase family cysteine hydrolase [Mariprofundus sp.]|nr:isochorismatase family cysteine hydrolase [Mariprofundus sp.]